NRVGHLVANFVGVPFRHRLRSEQIPSAGVPGHDPGQSHCPFLQKKELPPAEGRSRTVLRRSSPRNGSCRTWHRASLPRTPVAGFHRACPSTALDKGGNAAYAVVPSGSHAIIPPRRCQCRLSARLREERIQAPRPEPAPCPQKRCLLG